MITIGMEISTQEINGVHVVAITGDIDASTAPEVQDKVLPLVDDGSKLLLDMSGVPYMSSAGLRALLSLYRQASAKNAALVLVGLSEEITDTMTVTGFLDFFATAPNQDEGLAKLA